MAEEVGTIKFFKTDAGIKIEVSGEALKHMCCCCCEPSEKMESGGCCEPADKEKK